MNIEKVTKLIEAIVLLIQALIWPLIFLFMLIYFGAPIKKFLADIGEINFRAGTTGFETILKRQQIEAAALLGAAMNQRASQLLGERQVSDEEKAREITYIIGQVGKPRVARKLAGSSVLWVDDNLSNNVYERKALEALGIIFTLSTSTADALEKIRMSKYDAIISDMVRPPDKQAGYTLLEEKRKLGDTAPLIIYAGSNLLHEHKAEARNKGAMASTNNPQELFQLVISALLQQ